MIVSLVLKVNRPNILYLHARRGGAISDARVGSGPLINLPVYSLGQVLAFRIIGFDGLGFYPFNVHIFII